MVLKVPELIGIAAAVLFLFVAWDAYYTIDQGERGVILCNGAVCGEAEPGLHFRVPLVQSVAHISVQIQKVAFEKAGSDDNRMLAYSRDQQPATISLSVNYHVTDPARVYSQFGSLLGMEERVITPRAFEQFKNVFGQFNAVEAIQDRAKLNAEVTEAIRKAISGPLIVDSVQVEDITFSDKYEQAVEDRMEAQVRQQQASALKQQRIINADAAAYEVKAQADAKAHAITVQGDAEAHAIRARGDALRDNAGLPALVTAEKWDGHLPSTMPPNGAVPFLNVTSH